MTRDIIAFVKEKQITGKTFLRLNEGDLEGYVSFFLFSFYLMSSLNQRFELPKTHHPILLPASRSLRQNVLRGRIWGFESGHNVPIRSPQDDDFSSNSANVDVGRRSRNTNFDPTSNDNGRVKGMIAFLEQSSSSEEDDDHDGGRRSNSLNKNQRRSTYSPTTDERHSASCSHSPNKTQRTLPSRGTIDDLLSLSAGAGRGPSPNTRERSDTWTERKENDQIAPPSSSPALPTHACIYHLWLALSIRFYWVAIRSSFNGYSRTVRAWISPCASTFIFPPNGIFGFSTPQRNSDRFRRRRSRPTTRASLPLLPHNGLLPLLSSAGVGGERKREGVVTTVTSGFVIYHSRPRPGVGVLVEGFMMC